MCTEGTQVILLATGLSANASDAPGFAVTLLAMEKTVGLPKIVLADTASARLSAVATAGRLPATYTTSGDTT